MENRFCSQSLLNYTVSEKKAMFFSIQEQSAKCVSLLYLIFIDLSSCQHIFKDGAILSAPAQPESRP